MDGLLRGVTGAPAAEVADLEACLSVREPVHLQATEEGHVMVRV